MKKGRKILFVTTIFIFIVVILSVIGWILGIIDLIRYFQVDAYKLVLFPLLFAFGLWQLIYLAPKAFKKINEKEHNNL